jgi:hypothetical protein
MGGKYNDPATNASMASAGCGMADGGVPTWRPLMVATASNDHFVSGEPATEGWYGRVKS